MASIEKALKDFLLSKTAVTDLIGSGTSARYWPDVLDQDWTTNQGPCVVFEIISSEDIQTLADRSGFVSSRFKFIAYAGTRMAANATARAVKNCGLAAMKGLYSSVHVCGVVIESGIRTDYEKPDDGKATYRYLTEFDVMVSYLEE